MNVTCGPDSLMAGVTLVTASGQLDVDGANELWDAIPPGITPGRPSLLLDLSGVDIVTSAGVGTLMRALDHVEPLGGKLAVFGCSKKVRRVLAICELEEPLNVCGSAEEARERLRK